MQSGPGFHETPSYRPTMKAAPDVIPVIMAGGAGTRFWPLSTANSPKQFLTAFSDQSLYQQTIRRALMLAPPEHILVMTNRRLRALVRDQSPEIPEENVVLEPIRRDTAAAVILAAVIGEKRWPESIMVVMPADHLIKDGRAFFTTAQVAVRRAAKGGLGAIGIRPTYPATAFGYLRIDRPDSPPGKATRVAEFVEKPDRERAGGFLASGKYLWNAGIFVWRGSALLSEAEKHLPALHRGLAPLARAADGEGFAAGLAEAFRSIPSISIDFGVMEKASDVWVVPATFDWSDIGGWKAAAALIKPDRQGNRARGRVVIDRARGNLVLAADGSRPVLCAGTTGLIIVSTRDGTLVCTEEMADELKPLVQELLEEEDE